MMNRPYHISICDRIAILILVILGAYSHAFCIEKINDIYIISISEDLDTFAAMVNSGDSTIHGMLVNDIIYKGHPVNLANFYAGKPFCGIFDGAGHTITIMTKQMGNEVSFCRYLSHGGVIKNLHLNGSLWTCGYSSAALVGHMDDGMISNCLVTVNIESDRNNELCYGGLVGTTHGKSIIQNCVYQGTIYAPLGYTVAGLVGRVCAPGTDIRNCVSLCDFQVRPSDTYSNAVLNTDSLQWVTMKNVYYRGKKPAVHEGLQEIKTDDNIVELVYGVWGSNVVRLEKDISDKSANALWLQNNFQQSMKAEKEKVSNLTGGFVVSCILLVVLLVMLTIYYQKGKTHVMEINNLKNNLLQQEEMWKARLETLKKEQNPESGKEEEEPAKTALEALYRRLLKVMSEQELYKNPELNETVLARTLCTNNNRISTCINKITGKSINDWLASYRIAHAMEMIQQMEKEEELDINVVIEQSGYSSRSTFYRQFKKVTGTSPNQIKSQNSSKTSE